jgi:peptidylprolyl isomerase
VGELKEIAMKRNAIVAMSSRLVLTTIFVVLAGLVPACGSSYPSESTARKIMEDYLARLFPPNQAGSLRLKSFAKTNGIGDGQHYTLEFDAEIETLLTKQGLAELNRRGMCAEATEAGCIKPRKRSGKLHFEKTENGWRSVNSDEDIGNALANMMFTQGRPLEGLKTGSAQVGEGAPEITTASGLKYTDLLVGAGATPQKGQTVTVHYTGTLANGKKFDSSYDHPGQKPLEFQLGTPQIIQGWNEGIATMKVGGKRRLTIPSVLGYGPAGRPPSIPGNSTLVFDVELLGVK